MEDAFVEHEENPDAPRIACELLSSLKQAGLPVADAASQAVSLASAQSAGR
jgi:hypothetical protein